jgi:OPA family glycerol-3-phosphate transporter-like MFS transporter
MIFCAYLFAGLGEPIIGHFMDGHPSSVVFLVVSICAAASAVVAIFVGR